MQSLIKTTAWVAASLVAIGGVAATPTNRISVSFPTAPGSNATIARTVTPAAALPPKLVASKPAVPAPAARHAANVQVKGKSLAYDESLRAQMKFETVRWGDKTLRTLDEPSRILLAKAAARKARLHEVGLGYADVYGVIEAETSWIPRTGASKDGTANLGLAQFEPDTARRMGIADPGDPLQAVFGAALYMRTGAQWAAAKLKALQLAPAEHAAKVREGVSVHYNLSVKGRNKWDGRNTADLPVETQRHIRNARAGAAEAAQLARLLRT